MFVKMGVVVRTRAMALWAVQLLLLVGAAINQSGIDDIALLRLFPIHCFAQSLSQADEYVHDVVDVVLSLILSQFRTTKFRIILS